MIKYYNNNLSICKPRDLPYESKKKKQSYYLVLIETGS